MKVNSLTVDVFLCRLTSPGYFSAINGLTVTLQFSDLQVTGYRRITCSVSRECIIKLCGKTGRSLRRKHSFYSI